MMKLKLKSLSKISAGLIFLLGLSWSVASPQPWMQREASSQEDSLNPDQKAKMEKERREESFQKLKDDSERLYEFAGELKEMIEKSNAHTHSLQIVKKTEEIEKLLKDIKRRAKEGF